MLRHLDPNRPFTADQNKLKGPAKKEVTWSAAECEKADATRRRIAEGYYNLGVILDGAGPYDDAMKNLRFHLIAAPKAPDAEEVKELVYEIAYRKEKAAKDKEAAARKAAEDRRAQQEAAARKQQEFLNKINGARYAHYFWANRSDTGARTQYVITLDVRGDTISREQGLANGRDWFLSDIIYKIDGRTLRCHINGRALPENDGVISDDGSTMTVGQGAVFKRLR